MASGKTCWLFNTDETEKEGREKHELMLDQSCMAAWGSCRGLGAEKTLNRPSEGDMVYFFRAGQGLIACGVATAELAFASRSIFAQGGEYHRYVDKLRVLPTDKPIRVADIIKATGYQIPIRHIVCRIPNQAACSYIQKRFRARPDARDIPSGANGESGGFIPDPEGRKRIERLAVMFVTNRYRAAGWSVKSVESFKRGYDLECKKGRLVEHVEVKGTKGSELAFVITENEVIKARNDPAFRLSVVTNVFSNAEETTFTGAEFLRQFERRTIQYFARFVDSST